MRGVNRRLAAGLLAGGILIAGCGGGGAGGGREAATDREAGHGGQPEPGRTAPTRPGDGGAADGAQEYAPERESDGEDPVDPSPGMLSTFALDVDTASYSYAARTLREGRLPDPATVRPEEFVNSFRQDYRPPRGDGFSVAMDGAGLTEGEWSLLRVGLATREETAAERKRGPASLTFVIDVSGSMGEPGRLDLVKSSVATMIDQLRDEDALSLVTFSDKAKTVLPMTRLNGKAPRSRAKAVVADLAVQSSTNLAAGLTTGYREAVRGKRAGSTNRVVLLSDALANTGQTGPDAILEQISQARKQHGITLFGVGVGSDYGDALMEQLTNKGDGNTVYVSTKEEADRVFVQQLPRNVAVRARDAKAQVAFEERTVDRFRLIGYDNRRVADEDFRDDTVDGGEVGPGHTVTALYAVQLRPGATGKVATTTVRWLDPETREASERSGQISAGDLKGTLWKDGSPRLRTAAVATYFAEALRKGGAPDREYGDTAPDTAAGSRNGAGLPGDPGLGRLHQEALRAAEQTEDKDVTALADLIRRARNLAD